MKSKNTLTLLTLATASFLTACGSGGGKAPETMPAPAPKLEQEKTPEKGKEQGNEKAPEVAPPAPQVPEKKPEAPKPDTRPKQPEAEKQQPMPEARKTDQEVFKRLILQSTEGLVVENLFKLVFDDGTRKIGLEIVPPHSFTGNPQVETLRDLDGTLIGYYGYARVSEQKKDEGKADGEKIYAADRHFFIQYADPSQFKRPEGLENITYTGKMLYQYNSYPNGTEEADVSAIYSGKDKTLSMTISGKEGQWRLHQDKNPSSSTALPVLSNGLLTGKLAFKGKEDVKFRPDGEFSGGLYGKNGSILAGRAESQDKDKGWKGVIGATAVAPKK